MKRFSVGLAVCLLCLSLAACSAGKPAGLPGEGGTSVPDASTPGVSSPPQTTKAHTAPQTTVSAPAQTTPATTPPETAPPVSVLLPVTKDALPEAFSRHRPDYTLKEIVETDAGYFLFSMLTKPNCGPQYDCERNIDFLDKRTGIFAQNEFFGRADDSPASYFKGNITGYYLEDDASIILYTHVGGEPYGHRHFPEPYRLAYENGVLRLASTPADVRSFYPVETDDFYTGWTYRPGVVVLSARFASQTGFALLFNAAQKGTPADYLPTPRITYSFDGAKRQMTLFCPNIAMDGALAGAVPVSAGHPYINAAKIEAADGGVRVILTLKEAAELYIPWGHAFDPVGGFDQTHATLFEIEFTFHAARLDSFSHVFKGVTYLCKEK